MSQQHSFDLGDRRLEPEKSAPSKASTEELVTSIPVREPLPSEKLSSSSSQRIPMRQAPEPTIPSDPGVPRSQQVVEAELSFSDGKGSRTGIEVTSSSVD